MKFDLADWLGIPWSECGCYELTRRFCLSVGRLVPELSTDTVREWKCGDDMTPLVPADELPEVVGGAEECGDIVLLGRPNTGVVTNVGPVLSRGIMLYTGKGMLSQVRNLSDVGGDIVSIRRTPRC